MESVFTLQFILLSYAWFNPPAPSWPCSRHVPVDRWRPSHKNKKINSVPSNIPNNSSSIRTTVPPDRVPLCLTYIRWSRPNFCASLGLNCWFKINTVCAKWLSCITHCDCLALTQFTVSSHSSVCFCLFSISFISACRCHTCHHCLTASCFSA